MTNHYIFILLHRLHAFSLLFVLLVCCFTAEHSFANTIKIDAFGDSITAGWPYIKYPPWGSRTTEGYEPSLEKFSTDQTKNTLLVYNWGFPGENSSVLLNRVHTVAAHEGTFILLMAGANDPYQGIGVNTTIFNLGRMIEKSRSYSTKPILATVTPNSNFPNWIPILNVKIKQLAAEKHVILSDQYNALINNWSLYNTGDGLHPNRFGYELMAQTWLNSLKKDKSFSPINLVPIYQLLFD